MTCRRFSIPKLGNNPDENEDAADVDESRGLVTVADGATDAAYSRLWARLLVRQFTRTPFDPGDALTNLPEWLRQPQRLWKRAVSGRALPWFAEHKIAEGSFAAFLAVKLDIQSNAVEWSAIAVGDCCLFVVEDERLTESFPLGDPDEFGSAPFLVGTLSSADQSIADHWKRLRGRARLGALLLFMSDALAKWFLTAARAEQRPWAALRRIETEEAFADFVDNLRGSGEIRNDDSTLVLWGT